MVDVVDSKISSPSVAGVGKSPGKSSVFRILFFICLSHPSCISLQIPGDAYPGVKKYICRCVGIGRRGGLKIRWANNSCGFDPRHRHHICSEVSCFGAFFTAQKQNIEYFSETPEELHLQTRPYTNLIISIISGNALFRQGQRDGRKYLTVPKSFAEKHQLPKSSSARRIRSTIFTWNGHWLWQTSQPTHSPALCSRAS